MDGLLYLLNEAGMGIAQLKDENARLRERVVELEAEDASDPSA